MVLLVRHGFLIEFITDDNLAYVNLQKPEINIMYAVKTFYCTLQHPTLSFILIHPASMWTHWTTLRRRPCLSRAATSASSQLSHIFRRSLFVADLVLSCILVPRSTTLAVVCDQFSSRVQDSEVVFLSVYGAITNLKTVVAQMYWR